MPPLAPGLKASYNKMKHGWTAGHNLRLDPALVWTTLIVFANTRGNWSHSRRTCSSPVAVRPWRHCNRHGHAADRVRECPRCCREGYVASFGPPGGNASFARPPNGGHIAHAHFPKGEKAPNKDHSLIPTSSLDVRRASGVAPAALFNISGRPCSHCPTRCRQNLFYNGGTTAA
jgi:hypothetical protein